MQIYSEKYEYEGRGNAETRWTDRNNNNYQDRFVLSAPYDVAALAIGSHRFKAASWGGVTNPPSKLPPNGHFSVFVADGITKTITYIADTTETDGCLVTRCAELVVIDAVVETWNYFVSVTETENNGAIAVPSAYEKGRALDVSRKAAPAAYIQQYASLNRGTRSGQINFNSSLAPGNTQVTFDTTSIAAPPTNQNTGVLRNDVAGCVVFQYWYPDNSPSLYFRERSAAKIWSSWEQATEGNLVADGKVYVPSYARRGIGIGRQLVPVYSAAEADQKFRVIPGYGINVVDTPSGAIVSWSGSSSAIGADAPINYNPSTNRISLDSAKISQWDTAYSYGPHAGLYVPIGRNLTISGTAGRTVVANPTQSLGVDRSWAIDLATIHAGLTAGSTTQVAVPTVDAYGRVTALTNAAIAFPVTSVNGKTGAVSLSTTDVPEGTNLYWTNARGDARYSPLGHTHTWAEITDKPDLAGLYVPVVRTLSFLGAAGQIDIANSSQSLLSNRTWTIGLATVHAGLSGGSSITTPSINVDVYGRVTSLSYSTILFPVTSVNGKVGAVSLSTTDVPEGTNLYWTNARGDARYSPLGHIHSWAEISDKPDLAGLYVPVVRTLSFLGAAGQIDIANSSQSLLSNRTWTIGLATVHAGLSGGSSITTPSINVDVYGRVTSLSYSTILFPVTSVNGKTGAVSLSTTDVPEGTNLYWTNARGDARYSPLGHTHTWAQISGAPAFLLQAYTTVQADTLPVNQRSNLNFSQEFAISDSSANNRTTVGIAAVPYAKVTGVPAFLLSETDPTVPSYVKAISTTDIAAWNGKVGGSGTVNYVTKFISGGVVGDSSIYDNGNVGIGTNDPGSYKLRVNGAIYADGDAAGVALWMVSGRAIRATGTLNIDAGASSPIYFRSSGGASYLMELNANGKLRFNTYFSATAWTGTPVALLGTDNGGNVLTLSTLLYADRIHGHGIGDTTGLQSALDGKTPWGHTHPISEIVGLQSALDGKTPWGHNHDDRYYTQGQLNTSGGSNVHWDNITNKPGLSYDGHTHTIPQITGLQSALDGKTPWGHNHDDRYYTESESDARYLQSESDPKGLDSHWFSVAGSTVTHGIQRRDGGQVYASFNVPSTSSDYSVNWSAFTSGLGHHILNLAKSGGGGNSADLYEQDPKGVSYVDLNLSGGVLTLTLVRRDGTTTSDSVNFSS